MAGSAISLGDRLVDDRLREGLLELVVAFEAELSTRARFQLEFLLSLTVKVNAVLCGGKFLDDNLATLDDKLDVLTGN